MSSRTVDDLADVRTGDKGDTLVVAVVAREARHYDALCAALTPERVAGELAGRLTGQVRRTLLPQVGAMVLLLPGVLEGGVTGSAVLDGHGKALSSWVATLPV